MRLSIFAIFILTAVVAPNTVFSTPLPRPEIPPDFADITICDHSKPKTEAHSKHSEEQDPDLLYDKRAKRNVIEDSSSSEEEAGAPGAPGASGAPGAPGASESSGSPGAPGADAGHDAQNARKKRQTENNDNSSSSSSEEANNGVPTKEANNINDSDESGEVTRKKRQMEDDIEIRLLDDSKKTSSEENNDDGILAGLANLDEAEMLDLRKKILQTFKKYEENHLEKNPSDNQNENSLISLDFNEMQDMGSSIIDVIEKAVAQNTVEEY